MNVNREYLIQSINAVLPASFGTNTKSNMNNTIAPANLTIASRLLLGFSKLTYFSSTRKPNEIPEAKATYLIYPISGQNTIPTNDSATIPK